MSATNRIRPTTTSPSSSHVVHWPPDGVIWASPPNTMTGAMSESVIDLPPCADSADRESGKGHATNRIHAKSRGCPCTRGGRLPGSVRGNAAPRLRRRASSPLPGRS